MQDTTGAVLRTAREDAGMSLSALARRTNYTKGYLSNIENGRKRATPDVVLAYEQALGDDVNRRELLTGMAAGIITPMVMSEALCRAFTAALGEPISIDEWWHRSESYGRAYMSLGAGELSERLLDDMVRLQQYVDDPTVWAPGARLMTVYGKTLPSNQGRKGAIQWYRLAALMADRSADLATRVWVRGRAALALAYEGAELRTAADLANQALALSEKSSIGQLNAILARVHVTSERGDIKAALRELALAQRLFDAVGSYDQESDYAMPEWRFAIHQSMLFSRLGMEEQAIAAQETVERLRPASLPRFGTHVELHRGLMLARAGDKAGGAEYARTALDRLPEEKRSLSLQLMMAEIEQA